MSENEYKELIDFLGTKFEKIDERFEKIDNQFEKIDERFKKIDDQFEEVKRHTGVLIEAVEHKIDIVIEGVMGLNERLDRHTAENKQEHSRLEKMTLVNLADISKLDQRVGRLEEKI
ncbi:MAG: hypothetical protein WA666_00895 [Nitrospirota bacterium]